MCVGSTVAPYVTTTLFPKYIFRRIKTVTGVSLHRGLKLRAFLPTTNKMDRKVQNGCLEQWRLRHIRCHRHRVKGLWLLRLYLGADCRRTDITTAVGVQEIPRVCL